ncbi:MAG: hypothetical protein QOE45_2484 [Frankiaceae bacterium]|jgi:hypothetical protein|nr:hypothetical protein [Frankiaceae bacterium]
MAFRRPARPAEPVTDPAEARVHPAAEVYVGTTIEPEEGAVARIDSAADVDPNFKKHGAVGGPGGAGGFGGAGTK